MTENLAGRTRRSGAAQARQTHGRLSSRLILDENIATCLIASHSRAWEWASTSAQLAKTSYIFMTSPALKGERAVSKMGKRPRPGRRNLRNSRVPHVSCRSGSAVAWSSLKTHQKRWPARGPAAALYRCPPRHTRMSDNRSRASEESPTTVSQRSPGMSVSVRMSPASLSETSIARDDGQLSQNGRGLQTGRRAVVAGISFQLRQDERARSDGSKSTAVRKSHEAARPQVAVWLWVPI